MYNQFSFLFVHRLVLAIDMFLLSFSLVVVVDEMMDCKRFHLLPAILRVLCYMLQKFPSLFFLFHLSDIHSIITHMMSPRRSATDLFLDDY